MIRFPNAKINIGLTIVNKRDDGFHNLESVFYPVSWCDALEILPSESLKFTASGIDIPGVADQNLCLKAYQLIAADYKIAPVHIHLHKVIPIGAGLGGGSSDAAFTLKMLNDFFDLKLATTQLISYAQKLGSDCAFFIENKPTFAIEKGDIFLPITLNLNPYYILLVYPNIHISTKEAYSGVVAKNASSNIFEKISNQPISAWKEVVENDFETSILASHPALAILKSELYQKGALYAGMSGSGSTFFGIFEDKPEADYFTNKGYLVYLDCPK